MVIDRLSVIFRRVLNREHQRGLTLRARRWSEAAEREPELVQDVIAMGQLLTLSPRSADDMLEMTSAQLAYEAGRRDLAIELAALMSTNPRELQNLMENDDVQALVFPVPDPARRR